MNEKYLGDSYDMVKRFWAESLHDVAPLFAHAKFIPNKIREQYLSLTTMRILDPQGSIPDTPFGILLDPDTGIPLPSSSQEKPTAKHSPLKFILEVNEELKPQYIICFDQSHSRQNGFSMREQRTEKLNFLQERGLGSFYFESHASFLFASQLSNVLNAVRDRLLSVGVPPHRLNPSIPLQSTTR
jgi:hypothetical protein